MSVLHVPEESHFHLPITIERKTYTITQEFIGIARAIGNGALSSLLAVADRVPATWSADDISRPAHYSRENDEL